jgi:signal transduction histidine kinase
MMRRAARLPEGPACSRLARSALVPTLGRRLIRTNLVLGCGLAIMAAAGIWGVLGLRARVLEVVDEYEELRIIEGAITDVTVARARLESVVPDRTAARAAVQAALDVLREFETHQVTVDGGEEEHQDAEATLAGTVLDDLRAAATLLDEPAGLEVIVPPLLDALEGLERLEAATDPDAARRDATRQASLALAVTGGLAIFLAGLAITTGVLGYRGVMVPVRRLQDGVRRLAGGDFGGRIEPRGDAELAELARDFNRMATELDTLYRVMEEKVETKSRELVRSERLASVGFLAAGVAHELNNPLGIITGYAELAERWMGTPGRTPQAEAETREALANIREEAYRCKRITEQLLSLARREGEERRVLDPSLVIRDVVSLARGLPAARNRTIETHLPTGGGRVRASEPELKQVLLNLLMNAVTATDAPDGRIDVELRPAEDAWEIEVRDNGCGIAPEALGQVFEPFFTQRRGGPRGVGLGLAISHAIIEAHGGRLEVASDGPGLGASFVIHLPSEAAAVVPGVVHHA